MFLKNKKEFKSLMLVSVLASLLITRLCTCFDIFAVPLRM